MVRWLGLPFEPLASDLTFAAFLRLLFARLLAGDARAFGVHALDGARLRCPTVGWSFGLGCGCLLSACRPFSHLPSSCIRIPTPTSEVCADHRIGAEEGEGKLPNQLSSGITDLLKREYIAIVEPVSSLAVMTGHYRLARLRVSLLPSTRISRDRNPPLSFTAHGTEIKFARGRISKLLHIRGAGHGSCLH